MSDMNTKSIWIIVIQVCSNGGAIYIIGQIVFSELSCANNG